MAYIGADPADKGIGLFSQDTFTGDGSTTTFDMTNAAPDGGGNEIQVFVDNVRQQEGSSNAYTLGQDGSGDFKRITFTAAPAASQSIFVLNPGTKNVLQKTTVADNVITTAKVQDANITRAKLAADVIDATKLADDAVSEEHIDVTAITGHTELSETAADDDVLLIFDTSASALKKIQRSKVSLASPTFTSISPTTVGETGNTTLTITGTNFITGTTASLISNTGSGVSFDSVTRNSNTQLTCVIDGSNLVNAQEPYDIKITSGNGLAITSENQLNVNGAPVYTTSAGSLGSSRFTMAGITVNATDPESAGNVTFELQGGSLPPGISLVNNAVEGGTATFSGTITPQSSDTTFNFRLRAVDAASNTNTRAFSFTALGPQIQSFTSSGTFATPSGLSSVDVLVVGGGGSGGAQHAGGGGAGGLIFMPGYPVTPGGTLTVTVGCGGQLAPNTGPAMIGQDSAFGSPTDPGLGQGGVLTAKGGGGGAMGPAGPLNQAAQGGGSGGGAGYHPNPGGGTATQPTQPGNSGSYGFGNNGGNSTGSGAQRSGGGGGGAGAAGSSTSTGSGAAGGVGKAYTIADGTTPVYYAGGGGGAGHQPGGAPSGGCGGQGGGGKGGYGNPGGSTPGTPGCGQGVCGTANRGGGGGGAFYQQTQCGSYGGVGSCQSKGGKGVVIVKF